MILLSLVAALMSRPVVASTFSAALCSPVLVGAIPYSYEDYFSKYFSGDGYNLAEVNNLKEAKQVGMPNTNVNNMLRITKNKGINYGVDSMSFMLGDVPIRDVYYIPATDLDSLRDGFFRIISVGRDLYPAHYVIEVDGDTVSLAFTDRDWSGHTSPPLISLRVIQMTLTSALPNTEGIDVLKTTNYFLDSQGQWKEQKGSQHYYSRFINSPQHELRPPTGRLFTAAANIYKEK